MGDETGGKTSAQSAGSPAGDDQAPADVDPVEKGYIAVVHFHGIGSQRRLEETARMIDALDRYATCHRAADGTLFDIEARIEQRRDCPQDDAAPRLEPYVRMVWKGPRPADLKTTPWPGTEFRFYEVYWAPILAEGRSWTRTAKWFLSQVIRPVHTLLTPWRERQRLRRAALMELGDGTGWSGAPSHRDTDIGRLANLYDAFERLDAHGRWPAGTFADFRQFLEEQFGVETKKRLTEPEVARLVALAEEWRIHYRRMELKIFAILTTFMLAIALAAGAALLGAYGLAQWLIGFVGATPAAADALNSASAWQLALGILGGGFALFGLQRIVTDYVGDIEVWSTFAETDEKHRLRQQVLACGTGLLTHILNDRRPNGKAYCDRVIITAHSLGTAIAQDSLLWMARANRSDPKGRGNWMTGLSNLKPIEHFITLGSPIDKIEYFFESMRSQSHRYRRVVENLRGDIGRPPFVNNRTPHLHWINFWDDADPVSGPLHSPASAARNANQVDNVHVKGFAFPLPARSHTSYMRHRLVVKTIFEALVFRARSFPATPLADRQSRNLSASIMGPGTGAGDRRWALRSMLALPWLLLTALLLWKLAVLPLSIGLAAVAIFAAVLAALAIRAARKGPLDRF